MKGVSLDLVERVEYMFETFKQQNALNFEINYENIQDPNSKNIIDILLRYMNHTQDGEDGPSESGPASIDEILLYWKQFEEELEVNYVGQYCRRVFSDHK